MNNNCNDCSNDSLFVKEVIIAYCGVSSTSVDIGIVEPTPPIVEPPVIVPTLPEDHISFYVETSEVQESESVLYIESYDLIGPWEILEDGVLICNSEGYTASHVRFTSPLYENYFSILVDLDAYSDKLYEVFVKAEECIIGHVHESPSIIPYTINFNKFSSEVNRYFFKLTNLVYMNMNANLLDSIKDISYMFRDSIYFNSDISFWDVSHVVAMEGFLIDATGFNQDLSNWCVTQFIKEPMEFSTGTTNWSLPKPSWGYCPRGENGVITVPPIVNTEWVVTRIADGSSCGKLLVQASRTKDSLEVFSDIEVIPTVQQVSDEIMAGNYGTEVNNAVLAIEPAATDWVLDPANNRVKYTVASAPDPNVISPATRYIWEAGGGASNGHNYTTYQAAGAPTCAYYGSSVSGYRNVFEMSTVIECSDGQSWTVLAKGNPTYDPNYNPNTTVTKYIPIDTVAAKVISDAEACNTLSKDRLFNIVMPLAYSGFYNDLFEDNIL